MSNGSDQVLRASIPKNSISDMIYATVTAAVGPNFGGAYQNYHTPVPVFYKTITMNAQAAQTSKIDSKLIGIIIGKLCLLES